MASISATKWKPALTAIIEELDPEQYEKMLGFMEEMPKGQRTSKSREQMAQMIIEHYGEKKSILEIRDVMAMIPRNDPKVQDLLRPFLKKQKEEEKENKKVHESEDEEMQYDSDGMKSPQTDKEINIPGWRQSIKDLKINGYLDRKVIAGKVVQKSGLRTYKTKEKVKKFFYQLAVTDETDYVKVMVYGKERFKDFQEGHFYNFRNVIMDEKPAVMKVTQNTNHSKAGKLDIPQDLELEAQVIIYNSPVCSIEN
ncbi:uncharacterized protein LOC133459267 [Cololabis saira]|uniref:uncharacterized protein LOC133459267 n=1 Tax=Cololabis saira TaxID=129043 RepID=UPI002AD5A7BE|nr:uncharacterized protein LOC133459267 [Cololabis saira]